MGLRKFDWIKTYEESYMAARDCDHLKLDWVKRAHKTLWSRPVINV